MRRLISAVVCLGLLFAGAAELLAEPSALLITGGRVWTADADRPWAEAVLCVDGEIVAVGDRADIEAKAPEDAVIVDAAGGLVTPGWFDSHIHLFVGGRNLTGVRLRGAKTPEEFTRRIAEFAKQLKPGEWVRGGEWDHTIWGGELPSRDWIDAVTPDNPVWVNRLDGHMALANTAALRAAKVDDSAVAPEGGAIERDASGRMTGLLRDNAMDLVGGVAPSPSAADLMKSLDAANDYLLERGVTSVVQMGSLEELAAMRAARSSGRLRVRVRMATPLHQWRQLLEEIERNGPGDNWLAVGMLKGFVDGSLGSHTAAFLDPYDDVPSDRGLMVNTADDLEVWTRAADAAGLQVAVHAIGDRAIRTQLDVFNHVAKANGARDRRFRIEHAQHIAAEDVGRFASQDVIASVQPYHCIDDGRWTEPLIGVERSKTTHAYRSLLDAGARVAFGSDWYVAPATPIEGIYGAVTRRTLDDKNPGGWFPEQKISVEESLRAYTVDSAYAAFAEEHRGALRPGMAADLVVVDDDLFKMAPESINTATVRYTIVDGKVAYDATE
ncbi:N-substituted formamide deformylase precursor [Botrimarina colliarenosi]|uniref:N-substituted formamide deformylase n=1 Tax=Botrimarina colliarenosi TaxID=2528001 RepID=A0A5C6AII2_9BACT|nr:amidohydrolase [Botrimarina colliarenosi]TWT99814.1 N-substituted formamide deformylase precursor [Botrimarina colliarenosi]